MLKEINFDELSVIMEEKKNFVMLAYTNLCGTCERAKAMLNVVSEVNKDIFFFKSNVNLNQKMIDQFKMTSIPCFLMFKNGLLKEQFYAFHSVSYLFNKVKEING